MRLKSYSTLTNDGTVAGVYVLNKVYVNNNEIISRSLNDNPNIARGVVNDDFNCTINI